MKYKYCRPQLTAPAALWTPLGCSLLATVCRPQSAAHSLPSSAHCLLLTGREQQAESSQQKAESSKQQTASSKQQAANSEHVHSGPLFYKTRRSIKRKRPIRKGRKGPNLGSLGPSAGRLSERDRRLASAWPACKHAHALAATPKGTGTSPRGPTLRLICSYASRLARGAPSGRSPHV